MTFKITITRAPLAVEFEVGSIAEGVAILEQEDTQIRKIGSIADTLSGGAAPEGDGAQSEATSGGEQPAKRGRKPKNQPDPAAASAPPPAPIPGQAPPPAAPAAPVAPTGQDGPPAFLDRSNPNNVVTGNGSAAPVPLAAPPTPPAASAPPPPPPPPPAPPVAPPSGILAGKVIANLDQRKATTLDNGQQLADWLAAYGVVNKGASYDEAVSVIRLMGDDKLGQVATALQVA